MGVQILNSNSFKVDLVSKTFFLWKSLNIECSCVHPVTSPLLLYVLGLDMSHVTLIKGATATLLRRVSYIANLSELTSSYIILPISLVFVCRPSIYPFIDSLE